MRLLTTHVGTDGYGMQTGSSPVPSLKIYTKRIRNMTKIKKRLDDYLGFDSNELLRPKNIIIEGIPKPVKKFRQVVGEPLIRVFGGAVRDSIAGKDIHDVDIVLGSKMTHTAETVLHRHGFVYMENLTGKDLGAMYKDLNIIAEPSTWLNPKNMAIVQLIRPAGFTADNPIAAVVQNVDISCCGVSWDGERLYENYPDAVIHCQTMHYQTNYVGKMRTDRTNSRTCKLESRGWMPLKGYDSIRDMRIHAVLEMEEIEFVTEHGKEKINYNDDFLPF